jgi:hypothetical protein
MKKKFTPDPDQKPGGTAEDAGKANNEPLRPMTSGFEDPAEFDGEDIGRDEGGGEGIHHTRKKGPSQPA